ncbi:MAG: Sec-independent protein translocase, TatC subunit, partial [Thermoleophilia bacterium]|nr:Sec-independent protein translocase, TatC subunit [Thermoleophilia bacterium]
RGGAAVVTLPMRMRVRSVTERDQRMNVVEHLDELRSRLMATVVTLLLAFVGAFWFHDHLIAWLNDPLEGGPPVTLSITEPFMTACKVSFITAFAVAFPVLMWHLWRYIAPSFDLGIRRTVATYVGWSTVLMAAGVAFGYFVALPSAVHFLTHFDKDLYNVQVRASEYYMFACMVLLSVGLVFQLPVVLLALVRFRILSHSLLANNRKIAYISLMALAVVMPGVDPITTTMWMVPLAIMFEVSVLMARRVERRARLAQWLTAEAEFDPADYMVSTELTFS